MTITAPPTPGDGAAQPAQPVQPATDSIPDSYVELACLRDGSKDLRPAFSLEKDDVRGRSDEERDRVLGFVCAARTRLLRMYQDWYEALDIEPMLQRNN